MNACARSTPGPTTFWPNRSSWLSWKPACTPWCAAHAATSTRVWPAARWCTTTRASSSRCTASPWPCRRASTPCRACWCSAAASRFPSSRSWTACSLTTKTCTPKPWKCSCTACASGSMAAVCASPPCAAWAMRSEQMMWLPPQTLRAFPPRGTPPVAWQSQFHGGTGVGHAHVQDRSLFFAAESAAMSLIQRLRRASLWRLLALPLPLLAVVTGVELWMTRHDALEAANAAYDRSLLGALKSIDANISTASGGLSAELPYTMLEFFELTASGNVYFRVASSDGLVELGNADLPLPPGPLEPGVPRFYDATYFGESVRLAAYRRAVEGAAPGADASSVLVQVAESTRSRQEFTRRFVRRAALRDTLVLALMVLGTAATLAVALRPLSRLAREVQARSPDDMTPMADSDLPADIRPLVAAANQQMARTQDLVAQQRQFLDDASHQLRTHLTTLQMQIDYARREADATQVQHTLEAIGGEVARATRSTQQLLALGRSDTAAVELAPFDLAALLRAVALELLPRARARQIDFGIHTPTPEFMAVGDSGLLREALTNLAANAIAYTPEHGTVTVSAAGDDLGWSLSVEDNGPGLPASERDALGQRYRRGPPAAAGGSGLGLAIARSIAERHRGGLRLEEREGGPGLLAILWWPRG